MSKVAYNVPASENSGSGRVIVEPKNGSFRIRCTVKGCRFRTQRLFFDAAKGLALSHAGAHQFDGYR